MRDLQAVADRYQRILGIDHWRYHELATVKVPWDARSTDARLKVAFGTGGLTFELIQVLEGHTPHLEFLDKHGDGVQHIGFWTPGTCGPRRGACGERGWPSNAGAL